MGRQGGNWVTLNLSGALFLIRLWLGYSHLPYPRVTSHSIASDDSACMPPYIRPILVICVSFTLTNNKICRKYHIRRCPKQWRMPRSAYLHVHLSPQSLKQNTNWTLLVDRLTTDSMSENRVSRQDVMILWMCEHQQHSY